MTTSGDVFLAVLALFFPPLAVWVKRGLCSGDSLLNILLCVLGFIPGLIHAWYIIAKFPDGYEPVPGDEESGTHRVTYYYVPGGGHGQAEQHAQPARTGAPDGGKAQRKLQRGPSYGTTGGGSSAGEQGSGAAATQAGGSGDAQNMNPPPSYADAVQGDHKVQIP